jgi:molybdate transport system substrate-binding protein
LRRWAGVLALLAGLAGCGGGEGGAGGPRLRVSAAASLKPALTAYGDGFAGARVSFGFAASDQLAAQIRAGARPDVFASANAKLPEALHADGLVEQPVAFARNRLVIAVPAGDAAIRRVEDLGRPGLRLSIGSPGVPIGAYTHDVLDRLPRAQRDAILANVGSTEADVAGVVGKVSEGAVDAGFVYASDVRAAGGRLRAVHLPPALQPEVVYEAAVVRGTDHPGAARRFVRGLLSARGAAALRRAGFLPAP